jgi:hypothetical protein
LLERFLTDFSKCALKLLDNQADFDSAIRRFESSRPSQAVGSLWADFSPLRMRSALCLDSPPDVQVAI